MLKRPVPSPSSTPTRMNCLEVCGGNASGEQVYRMPGMDAWVWSQREGESSICGGHVHYFSSCASGRITRLTLADVCGPPSLFSGMTSGLRSLMLRNVNRIRHDRLVSEMGDDLRNCVKAGGCTTAMIATYFAPRRSLAICNIGEPLPLLYRAGQKHWNVLRKAPAQATDGTSAGVISEGEYQRHSLKLEPGDMLLAYSSAVAESREMLNQTVVIDDLNELVQRLHRDDVDDLPELIGAQVRSKASLEQIGDDATIVLLRSTTTPVRLRDNLLAPFRLFRAARDATRFS